MTMKPSRFFSQDDLDRIAAAVKEAETRTAGEIVPFVVGRSDLYEEAVWRGAFLLSFATLFVFVFFRNFTDVWMPVTFSEAAMITLLAGGVGAALVAFVPALKRLMAGKSLMDQRIADRAAHAFISEEVFNTRDRSGIMIFLSLLERRVQVVGDSGINAKVDQEEWNDVVKRIVQGMKNGKPADGLIDAIKKCGELLEKRGVEIRPDDTNELPDALRMSKE